MANSAVYQNTDLTTLGSWSDGTTNVYGGSYPNYYIADLVPHLGSGMSVSLVSNISFYVWTEIADGTVTPRAIFKYTEPTRVAATWYSTNPASPEVFEINLTDGNTRDVSIYFMDWDSGSRRQTVTIKDWDTDAVLDTRNINYNFLTSPTWITWRMTGHIKVEVQCTGGDVSLVSAFLFSDPISVPSGPTVQQKTGFFPSLM